MHSSVKSDLYSFHEHHCHHTGFPFGFPIVLYIASLRRGQGSPSAKWQGRRRSSLHTDKPFILLKNGNLSSSLLFLLFPSFFFLLVNQELGQEQIINLSGIRRRDVEEKKEEGEEGSRSFWIIIIVVLEKASESFETKRSCNQMNTFTCPFQADPIQLGCEWVKYKQEEIAHAISLLIWQHNRFKFSTLSLHNSRLEELPLFPVHSPSVTSKSNLSAFILSLCIFALKGTRSYSSPLQIPIA